MLNLSCTPERVVKDITYQKPQYAGNTPGACGAVNISPSLTIKAMTAYNTSKSLTRLINRADLLHDTMAISNVSANSPSISACESPNQSGWSPGDVGTVVFGCIGTLLALLALLMTYWIGHQQLIYIADKDGVKDEQLGIPR